jgi:DNA-binding transcriptional LysR family regulator
MRLFPNLELRFLRGTVPEVSEALKKGEATLAIAGSLGETWERLDAWPLLTEESRMVAAIGHELVAGRERARPRLR